MYDIHSTEADRRSPFLTCKALKALCGRDWHRKVVFVTSHWGEDVDSGDEERERRLQQGYWSYMLSEHSTMERYEKPGNQEKARKILGGLIGC